MIAQIVFMNESALAMNMTVSYKWKREKVQVEEHHVCVFAQISKGSGGHSAIGLLLWPARKCAVAEG